MARTATVTTTSPTITLVAGQTSPLTNDAGVTLTDGAGDVLTQHAPSMHDTSLTTTIVPQTVAVTAPSTASVLLVAGQTSELTNDSGDVLYADNFYDEFIDTFGDPLTACEASMHSTSVTLTGVG